jgi:hypothetical protein
MVLFRMKRHKDILQPSLQWIKGQRNPCSSCRFGRISWTAESDLVSGRGAHHQSMPSGSLEHLPHSLSSLGTTLDVALRSDLLSDCQTLGTLYRSLVHSSQVLLCLRVFSQILLARDENDGETLAKVKDLGDPLEVVRQVHFIRSGD